MVVSWALPRECGGCGNAAVYIDNDFRLCRRRLRTVVEARVGSSLSDEAELSRTCDETLERVSIIRCSTTLEFLAALELAANGDGTHPSLCAIDSIGAFVLREDKVPDGPPSMMRVSSFRKAPTSSSGRPRFVRRSPRLRGRAVQAQWPASSQTPPSLRPSLYFLKNATTTTNTVRCRRRPPRQRTARRGVHATRVDQARQPAALPLAGRRQIRCAHPRCCRWQGCQLSKPILLRHRRRRLQRLAERARPC